MSYPTIIRGMPDDTYHAHPAYGSTDLKRALRSPAHMLAARRKPQGEETAAKRDGKILHTCILEPHTFDAKYIVLPEDAPARPTDAMREAVKKGTASDNSIARVSWWEAWDANNTGKVVITHELYDSCRRIAEAVREHPDLRGYFGEAGVAEESVFAIDPETGLAVKCRNDWRINFTSARVVLDLKSCMNAMLRAFQRDAWEYGYFLSAGHYTEVNKWAGEPIDTFIVVAFEKEDATCFDAGHFPVKPYEIGQRGLDMGIEQQRKALALIKHCADVGEYPAYDTEIEVLDPPSWAQV